MMIGHRSRFSCLLHKLPATRERAFRVIASVKGKTYFETLPTGVSTRVDSTSPPPNLNPKP